MVLFISSKYLALVSPFKNHINSVAIFLNDTFFVVNNGNPSLRSNSIFSPNNDNVPVPVLSEDSIPSNNTFCNKS